MSEPAIYFTTQPHTCTCPIAVYKLARINQRPVEHGNLCPARCPAFRAEDAGPRMLGAGRGRVHFQVVCRYERDHAHEHAGIGADGNRVVWR